MRRVAAVAVLALLVGAAWLGRGVFEEPADVNDPEKAVRLTHPAPGQVLDTVGVASYNAYRHLNLRDARADWNRITANPAIHLIGWQETKSPAFRELHPRYRAAGWETWFHPDPDGPISLAFSWRTDTFSLADVRFRRMHRGGYPSETTHPFPARFVVVARLVHLATGRTVTLLNTHVNQHIETGDHFEDNINARLARIHLAKLARMWDSAPGDVVVGTGDYNFDYVDDARARPGGGISRTFAGHATSSYQVLGIDGLRPTRQTRWIDYVFLADHTMRNRQQPQGGAQFATHRVLRGFHSDHAPLLARIRLY